MSVQAPPTVIVDMGGWVGMPELKDREPPTSEAMQTCMASMPKGIPVDGMTSTSYTRSRACTPLELPWIGFK